MPKYAFLSPEWIEAARAVTQERADGAPAAAASVRMNLVVEEMPFGDATVDAHLDTTGGAFDLEIGHLDAADVKVSLDYATAKAVLVDGDGQVAMQAFMAGKVRVEGDMAKLLAFQAAPATGHALEIAEQIRAITS
ncbi:MAG TPA: SCP2 sterol-binding domain-containing protein [Acidimicrobiales bacterium]|nr:SCP2 sterol-binding domain-containing protein [Acidimicrobiales bacterium]